MTTYHLRCAIRNLSKGLVVSYWGVILQKWRKVLMPRCLPLSGCNRAKFHSFLSSIGGLLLQQLCCLDHSDVTAFFPVSTSSNSILHWISSLFIDCLCGRYYIAFRQAITNKHFFFKILPLVTGYGRLNSLSIHWNHSGRLCFEMNYKNSDRQAWFLQHAIANT